MDYETLFLLIALGLVAALPFWLMLRPLFCSSPNLPVPATVSLPVLQPDFRLVRSIASTSRAAILWRVLVPSKRQDGRIIKLKTHHAWDEKVRAISNGLTIFGEVKGNWLSPRGDLVDEYMIAVEIMCTSQQIEEIVRMTAEYYEQEAVFYCRISDACYVHYRNEGSQPYYDRNRSGDSQP